jgi:hypothetical protein
MRKKSMSVMEMGRLIGLKKTTAYWLVNKGLFEVRIVRGKERVMVDSFNKWLEGQTHYRIAGQQVENDMDGGKEDGIDS